MTETALRTENLTKNFGGLTAVNNLSLSIPGGRPHAIIGPNGAGKTTMMDIITGKTRPDAGDVMFDGRTDLTRLDEAEIANLGIGRKFQKPTVFESHTVWDNLEMALKKPRGIFATLFYTASDEDVGRITEILKTVRLLHRKDDLSANLSHGQKQWLEIGMLLMQEPRLLLVDEPVAGMTPQEVERTAELLLSLAGKHSVVVVEHDMEFVRSIARTVTVLHEGSVLAEGSMDAVQNDPKVIEVYLGESQAGGAGSAH